MERNRRKKRRHFQRMIISLPPILVAELRRYAEIFCGGNKSGFVADAVKGHIDQLRKRRHTSKLRKSYVAAARHSLAIAKEWQPLDDEAWAKLDEFEAKKNKAMR